MEKTSGEQGRSVNGRQLGLFPAEPEDLESILLAKKKTPSDWRKVVSKTEGNDYFKSETTEWNITYRFGQSKALLARIPEDEERFPVTIWARDALMEGIQFLQLNSSAMRWPCRPDAPLALQTDGSNLPMFCF